MWFKQAVLSGLTVILYQQPADALLLNKRNGLMEKLCSVFYVKPSVPMWFKKAKLSWFNRNPLSTALPMRCCSIKMVSWKIRLLCVLCETLCAYVV